MKYGNVSHNKNNEYFKCNCTKCEMNSTQIQTVNMSDLKYLAKQFYKMEKFFNVRNVM